MPEEFRIKCGTIAFELVLLVLVRYPITFSIRAPVKFMLRGIVSASTTETENGLQLSPEPGDFLGFPNLWSHSKGTLEGRVLKRLDSISERDPERSYCVDSIVLRAELESIK